MPFKLQARWRERPRRLPALGGKQTIAHRLQPPISCHTLKPMVRGGAAPDEVYPVASVEQRHSHPVVFCQSVSEIIS